MTQVDASGTAEDVAWLASEALRVEAAGELAKADWVDAIARAAEPDLTSRTVAASADIRTQVQHDCDILPASDSVEQWSGELQLDGAAAADVDVRRALEVVIGAFPTMTAHAPDTYLETLVVEVAHTRAPLAVICHAGLHARRDSRELPSCAEMLSRIRTAQRTAAIAASLLQRVEPTRRQLTKLLADAEGLAGGASPSATSPPADARAPHPAGPGDA